MFLGILNTILFNFSNNPFHLELKFRSIQIVVIASFVVILNFGIKRADCTPLPIEKMILIWALKPFQDTFRHFEALEPFQDIFRHFEPIQSRRRDPKDAF